MFIGASMVDGEIIQTGGMMTTANMALIECLRKMELELQYDWAARFEGPIVQQGDKSLVAVMVRTTPALAGGARVFAQPSRPAAWA
jgi:hypothetical protein